MITNIMVKIHFLNVGHGDCTIIEHASGNITMIDINNADQLDDDSRKELAESYGITGIDYEASLVASRMFNTSFRKTYLQPKGYDVEPADPVNYYLARWRGKPIFRFVLSHADLDHIRGVKRISQERIPILNFWDTDHDIAEKDCRTGDDETEWTEYQRLRKSTTEPKVFFNYRGDTNKYWNQDDAGGSGDGLYVLAPTRKLRDDANEAEDPNAHSYVIWFQHAGIKVVLGGDATETVWESIHKQYGKNLKCHILKASHHGRDSGYYQPAVEAMSPEYTVVSVGNKPDMDASNKYRQYCANVWSTRWRGNVVLTIHPDGKANIESECDREPPAPAPAKSVFQPYPAFGNLGR
ncbi:MAG: ComEC/Rec2 family competence protein [Limisphaerales bacterium]